MVGSPRVESMLFVLLYFWLIEGREFDAMNMFPLVL